MASRDRSTPSYHILHTYHQCQGPGAAIAIAFAFSRGSPSYLHVHAFLEPHSEDGPTSTYAQHMRRMSSRRG